MGFLDSIGDAFSDAASAVGGAVEDAASAVGHAAEDVAGAVAGAAEGAASGVASFAGDAFSVLKTGVEDVGSFAETAASDVANGVEDAAEATGSFFKKAAKAVGGAVSDAASGIWQGVSDVFGGVAGSLGDVFSGITDGVGGFFSNLVKGNVGDAFQSLIDGADKAFIQGPERLVNGVISGVQDTLDGASHLLGPLGGPLRQVIDRGADIVRTAVNTGFEVGRDAFRAITEIPLNFGKDLYKTADDLVHGNFKQAAKDFGGAFAHAGERLGGGLFDAAARSVLGASSILQEGIGLQPPSRPLTQAEKDVLKQVYGDKVDLDSVRIVVGGPLNADLNGRARTIGNTIYMPSGFEKNGLVDPKTGLLNDDGKTLVHETGHVWQSENGGGDYISKALYAQEFGDGYDYQTAINAGESFSQLNPEQQAQYIEEKLGPVIDAPGAGSPEDKLKAAYSGADLAYALDAYEHIQNGTGAA